MQITDRSVAKLGPRGGKKKGGEICMEGCKEKSLCTRRGPLRLLLLLPIYFPSGQILSGAGLFWCKLAVVCIKNEDVRASEGARLRMRLRKLTGDAKDGGY